MSMSIIADYIGKYFTVAVFNRAHRVNDSDKTPV